MSEAQSEIKSTVTVNTTDIAARAHDDKDSIAAKDIERVVKKRACEWQTSFFQIMTVALSDSHPTTGSNPVCGFSMMEQVRHCAVWPTEN